MTLNVTKKFTTATILAKTRLKELRLRAGYSVSEGAALLGVKRKVLEDMEAQRKYGKWLQWDEIVKACNVYEVKPNYFFE